MLDPDVSAKEAGMSSALRVIVVAAFAVAVLPAVAEGQDTTVAGLRHRIEVLERANAALEDRVLALEALIKVAPPEIPPMPASAKWRDLANWRRLRQGIKPDEVRALLGEPAHVDGGSITYWRWPDAHVYFVDGKVEGWSEPRQ